MEKEKYELIKFKDEDFELDVNVSPTEETVWLTTANIATLFERDRTVISKHIKNIFNEKELNEKSNVHFLHVPNSDKPVAYYSLDVIISVGYRVKSQRGIIFRQWANNILKQYLLKGYVVDENRAIISNENFKMLVDKVKSLESRIVMLEQESKDRVFFDGQSFVATIFIKELFSKAQTKIVIVDPYFDMNGLDFVKSKKNGVNVHIYVSSKAKITEEDVSKFNDEYGDIKIYIDDTFHDRFIMIDKKELYHLGTSLNSIGRKTFAITKMLEDYFIPFFIEKLHLEE